MASYKVNCPACGKSVLLEEEVQETFCPYCGSRFAVSQTKSSGRADSVVLYEATQVVNDIVKRVNTYRKDSMELYEVTHQNISNPFKKLLAGTDPFAMSEIHNNYFTVLDKLVNELDGHLSSIGDSAVKSELARKAVDAMLFLPKEKLPFQVALNFSADDVLAAPLVKHLSHDDLKSVYDVFTVPERRKQFYPNQRKLAEDMEKALGIEPRKGLARLLDVFSK